MCLIRCGTLKQPPIRIELPYLPPREFSPNSRGHWSERARAGRRVKNDVYALLREQVSRLPMFYRNPLISVRWGLPDKRRRDHDNLVAMTKPIIDALVGVVVTDDDVRTIQVHYEWFDSPRTPKTIVEVREQ